MRNRPLLPSRFGAARPASWLLLVLALAASPSLAAKPRAAARASSIQTASFGTVDGQPVQLYTLTNANGVFVKITNYGAIVTEVHVPDRSGQLADVVLGFDEVDSYVKKSPYFGAIVGRVANRIKNATFVLDGKTIHLNPNNPPNHLHGGTRGWDKRLWKAAPKQRPDGPSLKLTYVSPDGEESYPGTVSASVTYTLTNDNALRVEMRATTDRPTLVNMAHHSYWNLAGGGTILDHQLTIPADTFTPGDPIVPDGTIKAVKGTPFDFTSAKPIGRDLEAAGGKPIGFDHNWIVNGDPHRLRVVARLKDPRSGRVMTLSADQPGLQFYSGNYLDGSNRGKGVAQVQHAGLCLESQKFPNAINVPGWRDQVILRPGQVYRHTMIHQFTAE
jgi:aldose 1-epimerase